LGEAEKGNRIGPSTLVEEEQIEGGEPTAVATVGQGETSSTARDPDTDSRKICYSCVLGFVFNFS
jgi:hypothetical protein